MSTGPTRDQAPRPGGLDAERALELRGLECELTSPSLPPAQSWRPWLVRLTPDDERRFAELCEAHGITRIDTLDGQLGEFAAVRLPAADAAERRAFIDTEMAQAGGRAAYGCQVYLPWQARVYHLLDRQAYFEVITDRNRDKITREEQADLRSRRVGVVGLSVGGEAAFTLAQEHLCGEIVLADFDELELSNLNRLGTGFDALGLNKAVILARRIARVDPYLKVRIFPGGVTDDNLDAFLEGLDLLVEECDGLRMKYEMRRQARERGLNIVFAADERGFLSVEPYGDSPDLLPFHGRIDGPQPPRDAYDTPLEFMRSLTEWMGGWDQISQRSRASLEQLGSTLHGYPQLASEARYAAGQLGHVARRLLLGERLPPFIGHLDLDRLLDPD